MNRRPGDRDRELARALADARDRGRDSDRARARALGDACARYLDLRSALPRTLVALAVRMVALAVRLLPVAQRQRYCEEFLADMVELSRWERWRYALRVLTGAWQLRRALVEAARVPARQAQR